MTNTFIAEYKYMSNVFGIYSAVKYKDSNMYFIPRRGINSQKKLDINL